MFDLDLHLRFLRSATDAFFEYGQASMAAAAAWQDHIERDGLSPPKKPAQIMLFPQPAFPGLDFWTKVWMPWLPMADVGANPVPNFWKETHRAAMPQNPWLAFWPSAMTPAQAFEIPWQLRMVPWAFYQSPLIAMMMSSGVPYSVAAPAARASTSAMDAADAVQQQWKLAFSSYGSAGGHVSSHQYRYPN